MDTAQTYKKVDVGNYRKSNQYYFNESKRKSLRFTGKKTYVEVIELNSLKDTLDSEDLYWIDKYTSFEIINRSYKINRELSSIKEIIVDSQCILKLTDDWDDNESIATNSKTYFRAIDFLIDYSKFVFNQYNHIISPPEINIVRDGSIDLEWRVNKCILLINFKKDNALDIHFYTEDFTNSTIFKGILNKKDLNIDLAHWMKKV